MSTADQGVSQMKYTDDEKIGLKVLLRELDAEPMRMVNRTVPELISESVGRLFVKWSRQVDRDIAAGLAAPLPCRDLGRFEDVMQRWLLKTDAFLGQYQYELVEIIDWLLLAGAEHHVWLLRVDDRGRPLKLMKCGTVEALYNESQKAMRGRHSPRKTSKDLTRADERHIADIGAGYTVVELLTPDALDVESARMRHCIGHGAYDANLGHPGFHFYSIRDSAGQPCATVATSPRLVDDVPTVVVRQFQGPKNSVPEPHLVELFNSALDDILPDEMPTSAPAPARSVGRF
jgi:hypothetical protein